MDANKVLWCVEFRWRDDNGLWSSWLPLTQYCHAGQYAGATRDDLYELRQKATKDQQYRIGCYMRAVRYARVKDENDRSGRTGLRPEHARVLRNDTYPLRAPRPEKGVTDGCA